MDTQAIVLAIDAHVVVASTFFTLYVFIALLMVGYSSYLFIRLGVSDAEDRETIRKQIGI